MHASVIASDKNPDAKQSYGYRGGVPNNKSKDYHKVTSVAVWETNGAIKLFTGSHDGKWRLWATAPAAGGNGATLTKEFEHYVGGPIDTVHMASHFFFCGFEGPPKEAPDAKAGMVHSWNLNSPQDPPLELCISPMANYTGSGRIRSLWTTADGSVFSGGTDGVIRQWAFNASGGPNGKGGFALVRGMSGHLGAVTGIALAGPMLWSGGMDGTIRLWKPDSGENCHLIPAVRKDPNGAQSQGVGHSGPVTGLLPFDAPNNAGTFVFTSSLDESVKVWNAANGECVASENHGQGVTAIALTSDLKGNPLLLCGLFYGDIMIRGTISNPPLVLLLKLSHHFLGVGHELGPVNDVQPGPGNTFYAVADDGKLTVWQITGDFGL
jgi:WD40 repeat protein